MYKLMIVDDNKRSREKLKNILDWSSYGIEIVKSCHDGEEALEYILQNPVDLVICDVKMPGMSGIELLERIKENNINVKFIFASCFDDFSFVKSAVDMEAISYILKPVKAEELNEILCRTLNIFQEEQERIEKEHRMDFLIKKSGTILREAYLRKLLLNSWNGSSEDELASIFDLVGINYSGNSNFIVLCVRIIVCAENTSGNEVEFLADVVDTLSGMQDDILKVDSIIIDMETVCSILSFSGVDEDYVTERIIKAKKVAEVNTKYYSQWGISNSDIGFEKVNELYKSAKRAAWANEAGGNDIIFSSDIDTDISEQFVDLELFKNEINVIIENRDINKAKEFISKYFIINPQTSKMENKYIAYLLLNTIENFIRDYNDSGVVDFNLFWNKMTKFDSIEDIEQWFLNIFKYLFECMGRCRSSNKILAERIAQIIETNYGKNITINYLSEKLYYSGTHLNNIFRNEYGVGIFEYLTSFRIEKAKQLLSEPNCKLYKVVERVGYKNQAHFKYIFEKYTGMTPKEYQQYSIKTEQED